MTDRPHPDAQPHGELREVFPDIFFVTGSVRMMPLMSVSRNMVVIREGERLVLVHSMRLTDEGLAELDKLGKVTDVIRLAGFHGMDDPFYQERYGAKVWAMPEAPYRKGFDATAEPYFTADGELSVGGELPVDNARLIGFACKPAEAMLLLDRDDGILITGDALQNWGATNRYFSLPAKLFMKSFGFIKPHNVGPGWLKVAKPDVEELKTVLDLPFTHVLPVHGEVVLGDAKAKFRPAIEAAKVPA